MNRFLILLLLLINTRCAAPIPTAFGQRKAFSAPPTPPLAAISQSMLFKVHFQYGKKPKIGGLMLIKQTESSNYRVIFMAEVGATLFDFEFGADGTFVVHRAFEALNRPLLLKVIENDLKLLLLQYTFPNRKNGIRTWTADKEEQAYRLYRTKIKGASYTFAQNPDGNWHWFQQNRSFRITFGGYNDNKIPTEINMKHYFFPLEMEMKWVR